MGFKCGIVGLPNVGKSTIFNALTSAKAQAANYPFCTIEPNSGIVPIPDQRLDVLSEIVKAHRIVPTTLEVVDIAGLVKGASQGEGLGNQFLGHIREVDAIIHVVRCFDDENVTHVHGEVSPEQDIDVIETELMLADLGVVEKRIDRLSRLGKSGDKSALEELAVLEIAKKNLSSGTPLRVVKGQDFDIYKLGLLTSKPVLYVANLAEAEMASAENSAHFAVLKARAARENVPVVTVCAAIEAELSEIELAQRTVFLEELGLKESALRALLREGYKLLKLLTFFTAGEKEVRAWTCPANATAQEAAGVIHTDFARGFIRAEVISYDDFVRCRGENGAREQGCLRLEGKAYAVQEGDVMHFRFNV